MKLFKKLFITLSLAITSIFCLNACNEIYKYPLESIEVSSYVKEEAHISGVSIFFCIFGSYSKSSKIVQRYIFLAKNGPRDSYKINDVHVYEGGEYQVYFKYTNENEIPYLEYQSYYHEESRYWLYLPRSTVLELAQDMFRDL